MQTEKLQRSISVREKLLKNFDILSLQKKSTCRYIFKDLTMYGQMLLTFSPGGDVDIVSYSVKNVKGDPEPHFQQLRGRIIQ